MNILNNPLLSRNFSFYNLLLNNKGLFYSNRIFGNDKTFYCFITADPSKILSIMDLKFEDVDKADVNEFFNILLNCKYFKTKRFTEDVSKGASILLNDFAVFLKDKDFDIIYERIVFERIVEFFENENSFMDLYKKSCYLLKTKEIVKSKINGSIILKYVPDYDKTLLSITLPYFFKSFDEQIERDYFIMTTNTNELINEFLERTKHLNHSKQL